MLERTTRKSQTNTKLLKLIIIIVAVAIAGFAGWYILNQDANNSSHAVSGTSGKYAMFDGIITGRNNGCNYDATCSVTVGDKVIITGSGLTNNPEANVYGVVDADLSSGDHVKVKALDTKYGLTLGGCRECYITRGEVRR